MDPPNEEDIKIKFDEVCSELNLDEDANESAWSSYRSIYNDYVLEGSQIEWLACALYVACRSTSTYTVEGGEYSGNCISLTQILRVTKLRLIEFFRKVKKWLEMAKLPPIYLDKVEALERKFEVISVIFKKYEVEFSTLFQLQDNFKQQSGGSGGNSRPRSRKPNKARPCTSSQLFQFGWVLYVHIKNQFPLISDDLVNSHYLLLCCLDMLCAAAITSKRKDILNPDFPGLPEGFDSPSFTPSEDFPRILPGLCHQFSAIEKECQVVRDYYWWPSVRRLYESQVLMGTSSGSPEVMEVLNCLLQPGSFQANFRSLKTAYELVMLSEGDFDERVFLNSQTEIEGYLNSQSGGGSDDNRLQPGIVYQSPQHLQYGTPLTGREYLTSRENKLTPVSDANQSVIQLHLLLEECKPEPSETLVKTCSMCSNNPLRGITLRLEAMSKVFLSSFKADSLASPDNFALVRLQLSQSLYYKLLNNIIVDEERKTSHANPQIKYLSIEKMLEHDFFHKSLFAVCIEIVLFSYNSHSRIFPWVLSVIDISPYHFYKVIEVIIKDEPGFPRAIVKHLSKIEESVLSSLAWKSSSPLFANIDFVGSVPRYEEVALPNVAILSTATTPSPLSPLHRFKASRGNMIASPLSARDRYSSPLPASSRRQLFTSKKPAASPLKTTIPSSPSKPAPIAPKPPQGVVQVTRLSPLQGAAAILSSLLQQKTVSSPQKTSLSPGGITNLTNSPTAAAGGESPLTIQALVSMANMTSPLKNSPDKSGVGGQPSVPTITFTVSPSQNKTPQKMMPVATPTVTTPTTGLTGTPQRVSPPKPKRNGSVALFYRKVYQMAFLRIKDLCERLQLDTETIQKIWTCFEYSLVRSPDIMRERNIDQLIMCSVYIVAKVLRKDVTFQEIMRQYRHQPQAKSHVYRSVLLNNGHRVRTPSQTTPQEVASVSVHQTGNGTQFETESQVSSESQPFSIDPSMGEGEMNIGSSNNRDIPIDARGDIIQFYNKVFIDFVKDYVLKFSPGDDGQAPQLSPLPVIRRSAVSPRKLSKSHQIYISPLKSCLSSLSPLAKTCVVGKSTPSDFQELNHVTGSTNGGRAKRKLDALLSSSPGLTSPSKRPYLERTRLAVQRPQPNVLFQQASQTVRGTGGLTNGQLNTSTHNST